MKKQNVIALTSRISEQAHRFLVQELEQRGVRGIVPSHGGIMSLLFTGKLYTMKEIAEKIHRTKPTVTVLVDKLVQFGYVKKMRNAEDSRSTVLGLTEAGKKLEPVFEEVSRAMNAVVYQGLSEEEALQAERLLEKIRRNFRES